MNRIDSFGWRLANLEIRSGFIELKNISGAEKIKSNQICGGFVGPGENGQIYNIDCETPIPSKYITLQIISNDTFPENPQRNILQLNEVQINELIT